MGRELKVFKLVNGDEIVGYAERACATELTGNLMVGQYNAFRIEKPRAMQVVPTREGPQAALVPWLIANPDAAAVILFKDIMTIVDATKNVEDYYLEITSSIKLASSLN
jgi:hypothetical protein